MDFYDTAWFMRLQVFVCMLNFLVQLNMFEGLNWLQFVFHGFFTFLSLYCFCDGLLKFNGRQTCISKETDP